MSIPKKRQWGISKQYNGLVIGKGEGTIADCNILLPSRTEEQNYVNARLIALCPEMLQCLIDMDDAIDAHKSGEGIQGIYDCRKQLRKLLARLDRGNLETDYDEASPADRKIFDSLSDATKLNDFVMKTIINKPNP